MDLLSMDTILAIFACCDETDLARLRCVCRSFKAVIDTPLYPLLTNLPDFTKAGKKHHGNVLVRFLHRSKVGLDEGALVRRFKRWMRHTNNVSFGKFVHRMARSVRKHDMLHDVLHDTWYRDINTIHESAYGDALYRAITQYVHSLV